MKKEKIVILIAVVIVVTGTLVYALSSKKTTFEDDIKQNIVLHTVESKTNTTSLKTTSATTKEESKTYLNDQGVYVVEYTNNGFEPASLKIPLGKSVMFINKSTRGMRILSNEKVDTKFMELNESKTIGNGSSYTFSFVYTGLWAYYNQSKPEDTASILVY